MKNAILISAVLAAISMPAIAEVMGASQAQPIKPSIPDVVLPPSATMPMLSMSFDCGDCKPDSKIKAIVEGTYLDFADKEKVTVDENATLAYHVDKFRTRGGLRFLVGALAGADKISGNIECNGNIVEVSDIALSAVNGIESVARNVGESAYRAAKQCVASKLAAETVPDVNAEIAHDATKIQ